LSKHDEFFEHAVAEAAEDWQSVQEMETHRGSLDCELCWAGDGDPRCQRCGCSVGFPGCQCSGGWERGPCL
jgi:hypothetical protein